MSTFPVQEMTKEALLMEILASHPILARLVGLLDISAPLVSTIMVLQQSMHRTSQGKTRCCQVPNSRLICPALSTSALVHTYACLNYSTDKFWRCRLPRDECRLRLVETTSYSFSDQLVMNTLKIGREFFHGFRQTKNDACYALCWKVYGCCCARRFMKRLPRLTTV